MVVQLPMLFAIFLITIVGIVGSIDSALRESKRDPRDIIMGKYYGIIDQWMIPAYDGGWFVAWRTTPWIMNIDSITRMTAFIKEHKLLIKQRDVDMIRQYEHRPEILALVSTWNIEVQ